MKKKKKKKSPFDLDAAMADNNDAMDQGESLDANKEGDGGNDFDDDLDLESFGKKKKKKKKPFNLDEIENNLPTEDVDNTEDLGMEQIGEEGAGEGDYDLDVDFSKTKKKKKKKKDLDELVAEKLEEDVQTKKDNGKLRLNINCSFNMIRHKIYFVKSYFMSSRW